MSARTSLCLAALLNAWLGCQTTLKPAEPGLQSPAGTGGIVPSGAVGATAAVQAGTTSVVPMSAGGAGATVGAQSDATAAPRGGSAASSPSVVGSTSTVEKPAGKLGSWSSFGGNLAHTRSSDGETTVSVMNAKELLPAFDIRAPGVTATPAVVDGIMYWADWGGKVHAKSIYEDQKELWIVDRSANGIGDLGGGYTGSPAVTGKAVYVANRNGLLSAFERATGTPLWERKLDAGPHTHIWSSPSIAEADNVVVVGVGGLGTRDNNVALPQSQLESFRGWIEGADALTGERLWKFDVAPMPNGAGVSVWSSAALDPKRKMLFIGTGNNYYRPVSKYSDSLVALDYVTGEYKWHVQFTMNDAWTVGTVLGGGVDGDVGAAPNLFSINGRDVVGVGDKQGRYFVHDRATGQRVWMKELTNGGYQGGVMAPAAYQNGVIYVVSNNDTRSSTVFALEAATGEVKWRVNLSQPTFGGSAVGNGVLYVGDQAGNMKALNVLTGDALWERRLPQGRGGGFALVDGMLLTGYGYHFSESRREPLMGGVAAFSIGGKASMPVGVDTSDCTPNTAVTNAPSFTNVYQGVLCAAGCTNVCHSSSGEAGLILEGKAAAYASLVNVPAKGEACKPGGHTLVVPGSPSSSVLHGKLALMPACGVSMPPAVTAQTTPITPAMLEAVRTWISAGAPND